MITTTHGDMDETTLTLNQFVAVDNDDERTVVTEYWMSRDDICTQLGHDITQQADGKFSERVHRSVDMTLKRAMGQLFAEAGSF